MRHTELFYLLALQKADGIGDVTAKRLLSHFGSAEEIFKSKPSQLAKIDGVGSVRLHSLRESALFPKAENELRFIESNGIGWNYFADEDYPAALRNCPDCPILIFRKGNIDLSQKRIVSIVGTRNMTARGSEFVESLVAELALFDPVIVSGFAFGIDIAAHKAAMHSGLQTVAVVAHGLNRIYPRMHQKFLPGVLENGGLMTEFWSDSDPERAHFIRRNRIVAGLSQATIVVESGEKGGSLITANFANDYDREVFAVPGRPGDLYSKGCNDLIRTSRAHVLTSAADLIYLLGWGDNPKSKPVQRELAFLGETESCVVSALQRGRQQLDDLALDCSLPVSALSALLLELEMKGVVRALPGRQFEIT
jgi:DNA processing protein